MSVTRPVSSFLANTIVPIALAAVIAMITVASSSAQAGGGDWNQSKITWHSFDEGMKAASTSGKPVCIVFHTSWCPHCKTYRQVFFDERMVKAAKDFTMILIDRDAHQSVSERYGPDGQYIPRTIFLDKQGVIAPVNAGRPSYKHFYNTKDPRNLLEAMAKAKAL